MKKIFAWLLLLTLVVGMFAGCKKADEATPTAPQGETTGSAQDAIDYLKAYYTNNGAETPIDYTRFGIVRIAGVAYDVVWTVDVGEDLIKIVKNEDGTYTIDVNEDAAEETPYKLTATVTDAQGNTASYSWDYILPKAQDMVAIVEAAYALENGKSLPYESRLRGKVVALDTPYSEDFQNITVTIAIEGAEDKPIKCYRMKATADTADVIKNVSVGNIITVTGTLKNYQGTIEFDTGCLMIAWEKGDAIDAPTDPGEILKQAYELAQNQSLPYVATLTGTVTKIDSPYDAAYGNISVVIVVEGYEQYPILCYRMKGLGVDQIAVNDLITVTGIIKNYKGTIEYDSGCQMTNRVSGGGIAKPESFDAAQILADARKLNPGQKLEYYANLTGKVTEIDTPYDKQYGNISVYISVNGTQLLCYRLKSGNADVSKIARGDTVTVRGLIENYKGSLQFGSGSTLNDRISGGGVAKPESSNASQILSDAARLGSGDKLDYYANLTGKVVAIDTPYDREYGNLSVVIDVNGTQLLCYRLKSGAYDCSKIATGDTITVRGVIENYKGDLQFGSGSTLEGRVSGGGVAKPESSNAAQILADAANLGQGEALEYYANLTGKVIEIDTPYDKEYKNLSVVIDVDGTQLLCYRLKSGAYDCSKIAKGDTITVRGVIENYKGEIQFGAGATLEKRVSGGGVAKPESSNAADILADAANLAQGEKLDYYANLTGKVTSIKTPYDANYGNISVYIDVDGTQLLCYRLKSGAADASKIAVGDTITVRGVIENYKGEIQLGTGGTLKNRVPGEGQPDEPVTPPELGDAVATVVIYNPSSGKALSSNPSREGSFYLGGVDVTVNGTAVTGFGATEQWNLYDNGDGTYSFAYNGKNLAMGSQYSSTPLGDVNDDWKVIDAGNGLYYIENTVRTSNRLQWRAETYNYFSCYHKDNTGDAYKFAFYVVSGELPNFGEPIEPPTTDPSEPPVDGDYVKVTNASQFTSGKYVMIVDTGYAPGAENSYWLDAVQPVVSGNSVTDTKGAEWTLTVNGNSVTLQDPSGKLIGPKGGNNNGLNIGSYDWAWSFENGKFVFAGTGSDTVYLASNASTTGQYPGNHRFRGYKTSTVTSNPAGYPFQFTLYKLGGEYVEPEVTEPSEPTISVKATVVDDPVVETAYKLGMDKGDGKVLYFTGNPESAEKTYRLETSEDASKAVDVYLEAADGGYRLYFNKDGVKNYIRVFHYEDGQPGYGKGSLEFATSAPEEVYTYDETAKTLIYDYDGNNAYYMGTYGIYVTICVSNTSFITGDKASNIDKTQFPARFYTVEEIEPDASEPSETEPTEPPTTEPGGAVATVVIYNPSSGKALSSNPSREGSFYLGGVDVTVNGSTVTGFGATEQWNLIDNGDGTYSFSYGDKNLAMGSQYSSTPLGEVNDDWKVIDAGNGLYYIENTVRTDNRLQWRAETYNYFICYYKDNTGDAYKFAFYVVSGELPNFGESTETEPTDPPATEPGGAAATVVIYNPSSGKALSSNPSRDGSFYLGGVDVTVNGTAVTGFGATEQWNLIDNGNGTYSFAYNGKNLSMGSQYSSTPLGDVNDDWKVIDAGNGLYYIENTVRTDNRLQWRAETYNYFSCYYKDNTGDAYKFAFYVVSGKLPFGESSEPEATEPEATEPEATQPSAGTAVTYTFSNYGPGTQYTEGETYDLDKSTSLYLVGGHMNTQLRLYDDDKGDAQAIFTCAKAISSVVINAGHRAASLAVYASVDGQNWVLIQEVATQTSFGDFTVEIPADAAYKYLKLDAVGAQIRIPYITFNFEG